MSFMAVGSDRSWNLDLNCTASPNFAGSPGAMTRYRRSAVAELWTICRIGPTALTMAEPAGLVMKAASGCSDPVPSLLSASAST